MVVVLCKNQKPELQEVEMEKIFCEFCGEEMLVRNIKISRTHVEINYVCPNCKNREREVILKGGHNGMQNLQSGDEVHQGGVHREPNLL